MIFVNFTLIYYCLFIKKRGRLISYPCRNLTGNWNWSAFVACRARTPGAARPRCRPTIGQVNPSRTLARPAHYTETSHNRYPHSRLSFDRVRKRGVVKVYNMETGIKHRTSFIKSRTVLMGWIEIWVVDQICNWSDDVVSRSKSTL